MKFPQHDYLTGVFLINLLGVLLIISSIAFLGGIPISAFHLPAALALTSLLLLDPLRKAQALPALLGKILLVLSLSLLVSRYFYDVSWDGQMYHQLACSYLSGGWNPVAAPMALGREMMDNYILHYGHGAWILSSAIDLCLGNLEFGKAVNWILAAATFLLSRYLLNAGGASGDGLRNNLLAALITFNPVVIYQLATFYVDQQVYLLIVLSIISLTLLYREWNSVNLLSVVSVTALLCNSKSSGIAYMSMIVGCYCLLVLWRRPSGAWAKMSVAVAAVLFAVFVVGYSPYVINIVSKGNLFYPATVSANEKGPDGKVVRYNVLKSQMPEQMRGENRFRNLVTSLTSEPSNASDAAAVAKIPFAVKLRHLKPFTDPAVRLSGFGPLFYEILILSALTAVCLLLRPSPGRTGYLFLFLGAVLVSVLLLPEQWWARIVPQLWLVPVSICCYATLFHRDKAMKSLGIILLVALSLNIVLVAAVNLRFQIISTERLRAQLSSLYALADGKEIGFRSCLSSANRYRLAQYGFKVRDFRGVAGLDTVRLAGTTETNSSEITYRFTSREQYLQYAFPPANTRYQLDVYRILGDKLYVAGRVFSAPGAESTVYLHFKSATDSALFDTVKKADETLPVATMPASGERFAAAIPLSSLRDGKYAVEIYLHQAGVKSCVRTDLVFDSEKLTLEQDSTLQNR